MGIDRKLKRILEEHFPSPDHVELRDKERVIGIVTSKRFRRKDSMQRQEMIHDILSNNLTKEERQDIAIIVCVTPEEALALSQDGDD